MFTQTSIYAIRALIYIAYMSEQGKKVSGKEVAKKTQTPESFVAKILQKLSREGLLTPTKGPYGGFSLTEEQIKAPIAEIIECLEGKEIFTMCGLGFKQCSSERPCPVHFEYAKSRNELRKFALNTTIKKMVSNYKNGKVFLFSSSPTIE